VRVLALVTDAFGVPGGIAQYNCHFLASLAACQQISEVIVLPRRSVASSDELPLRVRQLRPVQGKLEYTLAAFWAAQACRDIRIVFCGHLFMAPLAAALAKLLRARLWIQVHGIEAWQEPSGVHQLCAERAALIT
jgi:phosphatidylinositol alpha-1,6-mannosyltransferase